jgi:light-regulated signal transduction histidine kinase (bacteriophytochrome)
MTTTEASTSTQVSSHSEKRVATDRSLASLDLGGLTPDQFRKRIKERFPDLVLTDDTVAQWRGIEALEVLRREGREIPLILFKAAQQEESTRVELAQKIKELARSNAELEQFASVASHDLQEPLRMISTYTQILAEQYSGKLDEKADKYIRYVVDGAVRMGTLIRDLLEFSRIGRTENGLKSTDSGEEVRVVVSNLQATIDENAALVTWGPLPIVMAHGFQLRQVFQNLIGNAIKFHDGKPPSIQVDAERKGADWVFSVTDNGISIAPQNAAKIFAIFQRLHTREEYPGNGIGLAICKKIVEQHGGQIWVEPLATQGAVFKFTWPARIPENGNDTEEAFAAH